MWRTTPMHRREVEGDWREDAPPKLPADVDRSEIQRARDGVGPFLHRRYRVSIRDARRSPKAMMREIQADPNLVVPSGLAHVAKVLGREGEMRVGDEFTVRMPGPWDGPVRVVDRTPRSFRFATLQGHIEAGQIEWRARREGRDVVFEIESWSRPGDRLSHVLHHRLRMAKEVQLHMWTSVLERVVDRYGGRRDGPIEIDTRRVERGG
jgi:hypothetical protein